MRGIHVSPLPALPGVSRLYPVTSVRAGDVLAGNRRVFRLRFDRDHPPGRPKRAREPERAVTAERPDLEDRTRTDRSRQQVQELALCGRHVDGRQAGRGTPLQRAAAINERAR